VIARYTFTERVVHWIAAVAYLYLLLTGLAFYSPRMYWLTSLFGGGPTARAWHPWAGLIFAFTVVWMWRMWRRDMGITEADREWSSNVKYYITNQDDKVPGVGRFNAGQKQLFWLMFWGGILLLASGLVLWFTDFVPWSMRYLRYASVLVHVLAFLLTLAGFIVHVYMGAVVAKGGFSGITRGEIPVAFAKHHHRLWYNKMTAGK
jgi:formate dehydrogenase subunit gamma